MKTFPVTVHGVTYATGTALGARLDTVRLWCQQYGVTEARQDEFNALAAAAMAAYENARPLATVTPLFTTT